MSCDNSYGYGYSCTTSASYSTSTPTDWFNTTFGTAYVTYTPSPYYSFTSQQATGIQATQEGLQRAQRTQNAARVQDGACRQGLQGQQGFGGLSPGTYVITQAITPQDLDTMLQQQQAAPPRDYGIAESIAKREEANNKALALLKKSLTKIQLERFEQDECIPIDTAKGNRYLIEKKGQINILVLDKDNKPIRKLCTTIGDCPIYDNMLAQKLYLETCEEEFLKIAHVHPIENNITFRAYGAINLAVNAY